MAGGGYDVAWKETGADQYTVWSLDGNGNQTGNLSGGAVTGESATLENFETIFGQDLNGDGHVGPPPPPPPTTISIDGNTTLVQSGNNYFLEVTGNNTLGPEVKQAGAPVTAGAGGWSIIGAVQVAGGGYDVAWKETGADQYTVWSLDSNGNQTGNIAGGAVTGESATLENFETIFGQDLNGDGHIGIYFASGATLQIASPLPSAVGPATIGASATLELSVADSASITFNSSTGMLKLDSLTAFTGVIDNFAGNGSLSGSDQIDLKGINFEFRATASLAADSYSNGILTMSPTKPTPPIARPLAFLAMAPTLWRTSNSRADGNGGTNREQHDPPVPAQPAISREVVTTAGRYAAGIKKKTPRTRPRRPATRSGLSSLAQASDSSRSRRRLRASFSSITPRQ